MKIELSKTSSLKSQISVEYLAIMGFVGVVTLTLLGIYFTTVQGANDEISSRQAMQIARKIADASESVYYLGEPSQTTLKVSIPDNIKLAYLNNTKVVFGVKTKDGVGDIVQLSSVNMTGQLPTSSGIHTIVIKAESGSVAISYS